MEHPNNDQQTSVEQHLNLTPGPESGKVGLPDTHRRGCETPRILTLTQTPVLSCFVESMS